MIESKPKAKYQKPLPKCQCCKERFTPYHNNGLQKFCIKKDECIKAYAEWMKSESGRKAKKVVEKKADKEIRRSLKTLTDFENEAKKSFQKFIRLRDAKLGCKSCLNPKTDLWDGGHFKKAEIYSGLIFDERNCHKQCRKCNRYLGGNEGEYRISLVKEFGNEWVEQLEADANATRQYSWTREELIEKKRYYDQKIKELSNENS